MAHNKSEQTTDPKKQDEANNDQHHQDKAHHQGVKEMPTSLPNQKISSDGKKLPLSDEEKASNSKS